MNKKTILLISGLIVFSVVGALTWFFLAFFWPGKEVVAPISKGHENEKRSCETGGGTWMSYPQGPFQLQSGASLEYFCNFRTADAGKECIDSSECEGECIAKLSKEESERIFKEKFIYIIGKCDEWRVPVQYCPYIVREGKIELMFCD